MAKVEGTQSIPASIADLYSAALTPKISGAQIRRRCPFNRPLSAAGGPQETDPQRAQRNRFKTAQQYFRNTDETTRQRWYESAPIWHSFLWYYNYFMLSALMGVTGIPGETTAVIKSIQHIVISMPSGTGTGTGTFTSIDADKAVVMMNGNSVAIDDESGVFWSSTIYPYLKELADTSVKLCWSIATPYVTQTRAATVSVDVIEYI